MRPGDPFNVHTPPRRMSDHLSTSEGIRTLSFGFWRPAPLPLGLQTYGCSFLPGPPSRLEAVEHPSCRLTCRTNSLSTCLPDCIWIKQTPKGSTLISQSAKSVRPEGIEPSLLTYQVRTLPLDEGRIKTASVMSTIRMLRLPCTVGVDDPNVSSFVP